MSDEPEEEQAPAAPPMGYVLGEGVNELAQRSQDGPQHT